MKNPDEAEAVRLVIWDLDDTFWHGTLTEGGITYNDACHDLVIALAQSGIMSSLCSKNDLSQVKAVLEAHGIWEYFVFPSVSWDAKGPRIADLIARSGLRPATVMFIDDNALNLEEARHFVPGLQVRPHTFITAMADSPLFAGKPDAKLTRLAHYKLLEARQQAQETAGGDNHDFLRGSDIRLSFDYQVDDQLDRVIELINRTNQLNFTKTRLPEDPAAARAEIGALLAHHQVQAALIRVSDRYGDYGPVGFYAVRRNGKGSRLLHFCFSCRTLNMGIETWVYRHLGQPKLKVRGEVASDVAGDMTPIDWISVRTAGETHAGAAAALPLFDTLIAHGGCDQRAMLHYLAPHARVHFGIHNVARHGLAVRPEHSQILRLALEGAHPPEALMDDLRGLGFEAGDFDTPLSRLEGSNNLIILSFWGDYRGRMYRHKATDTIIPFRPSALKKAPVTPFMQAAADVLKSRFVRGEPLDRQGFEANLRAILAAIHGRGDIFLIKTNAGPGLDPRKAQDNTSLDEVAAEFPGVRTLDILDCVMAPDDIKPDNENHFDRKVYYRLYEEIMRLTAPGRKES